MRKFSIKQAPFMAFFSPAFYEDVAENWTGLGLLYLLILYLIDWMLLGALVMFPFSTLLSKEPSKYISQLPTLTLSDHTLSIDKPMPYEIKDPVGGTVAAIIDTKREAMTLEEKDPPLVVTSKHILQKDADGNSSVLLSFGSWPDGEYSPDQLQSMINMLVVAVPFVFLLLMGPVFFVFLVIQALVYGVIAILMSGILKKNLSFTTCVRLATMAMTPAMVLTVPAWMLGANNSNPALWGIWSVIAGIITVIYLAIAVKVAPVATEPA
jgi:hypothetical protein